MLGCYGDVLLLLLPHKHLSMTRLVLTIPEPFHRTVLPPRGPGVSQVQVTGRTSHFLGVKHYPRNLFPIKNNIYFYIWSDMI